MPPRKSSPQRWTGKKTNMSAAKRKADSSRQTLRQGWKKQRLIGPPPDVTFVQSPPPPPNSRIGGFLGQEVKFFDTQHNDTIHNEIDNANINPLTVDCLNAMKVGAGEQERQGRKILMKRLEMHFSVRRMSQIIDQYPLSYANQIRVVVYMDTQANKAGAAPLSIFNDNGLNQGLETKNMEYNRRFVILSDKHMEMPWLTHARGTVAPANVWTIKSANWKLDIPLNVVTDFAGSAGTIANITDNAIRVLAWGAHGYLDISYTSRLHYTD